MLKSHENKASVIRLSSVPVGGAPPLPHLQIWRRADQPDPGTGIWSECFRVCFSRLKFTEPDERQSVLTEQPQSLLPEAWGSWDRDRV